MPLQVHGGVIIPNNNALGVRRIEARQLDGTLFFQMQQLLLMACGEQ
jgi:hypothetical protein